jgi:hypothetical protein
VLVHVIAVDVVKMTIVQIVDVTVVLHRRVAARGDVGMRVTVVLLALISHLSPFSTTYDPPATDRGQTHRFGVIGRSSDNRDRRQ